MPNTNAQKSKVLKTTRILFNGYTLYTSTKIVNELRHLLIRADNNRMMIKRGEKYTVTSRLRDLAVDYPNHFTQAGLDWILSKYCAGA